MTASQDESSNYHYNIICVVLITEFVKLFASTALYCKRYLLLCDFISVFAILSNPHENDTLPFISDKNDLFYSNFSVTHLVR